MIDDTKEYVLCAAIHFDDGKKYEHQPVGIESGLVLCAYGHAFVYQQLGGLVGQRKKLLIFEKQQGFLTSHNRFVSRKEAGEIAIAAGQIKKLKYFVAKAELDSSELYGKSKD